MKKKEKSLICHKKENVLERALNSYTFLRVHSFLSEKEKYNIEKRFCKFAKENNLIIRCHGLHQYEVIPLEEF